MPKYLFTSDLRISQLDSRIKEVATYVQQGSNLSDITDKSDNNNATTLASYFCLYSDSEVCKRAADDPKIAIRNFILKFQFPNTRTSSSLKDCLDEKVKLAPFRVIVSLLHFMASKEHGYSQLSFDEILWFIFCDEAIYTNPHIDYNELHNRISVHRAHSTSLTDKIEGKLEWNQYDRQFRELLKILPYASECFVVKNKEIHFSMKSQAFAEDILFVNEILNYKFLWYPSSTNNFQLAQQEYNSFLDIMNTPYQVIDLSSLSPQKKYSENAPIQPTDKNVAYSLQDYEYMAAIKAKPFLILGGFSGTGKSLAVKRLAFSACPADGSLNLSETSPGNYLLISVKPNWHDATDLTGFRSSVNNNYYVTDFMRFLVKAMHHSDVPFFVCLDEMNLAPVEEYFSDFLSVIESRKRKANGEVVTDALVPASVFNDTYAADFNIFMSLGLETRVTSDEYEAMDEEHRAEAFVRQDIVDELKREGLTIPQNVIVVGTVNMDDTTNTFSRKVIDRAMTFETIVGNFDESYFNNDVRLNYVKNPRKWDLFRSDEVNAQEMVKERFGLDDSDRMNIIGFINGINEDLEGTPFKISYRILNETVLLYRAKKEIERMMKDDGGFEAGVEFKADLDTVFDDILMQKVLPRIEGDSEKCRKCLAALKSRANENGWQKSAEKIQFMIDRFGSDGSGFTSFWN